MPSKTLFVDNSLIEQILTLTIPNGLLLFGMAFLFFVYLPRWVFPQEFAGGGIERTLSNILYMLAYVELVVPLMIVLKVFSLTTFLSSLVVTKLLFYRFYYKQSVWRWLVRTKDRLFIALFDLLDSTDTWWVRLKGMVEGLLDRYFLHLSFYHLFYRVLFIAVWLYLLYILGYRCFIALSNPLPDTGQFIEWVATLHQNVLYADNKTAGADFYGISVFIFILQTLTNIDSIILFSLYPLLLISFLLFGVYFVIKRFSLSALIALSTLLIYGVIFVGSNLNSFFITPVAPLSNPEIIHFLGLKLYTIPKEMLGGLSGPNFTPYMRYFSGMAYEFSSALFLINLFYLIKALDRGYSRYLINYTLSLMLVFIFHGGGAIALIVPSILIALNALVSMKLSWSLLKRGLLAILIAAIFGNGWVLSVLKYGIPQDFGAAAPFFDKPFCTKQAVEDLAALGAEEVTISYLTFHHLWILLSIVIFFFLARFYKKGFYFSSFLLIPLGIFFIYFAENLGFSKIIHQDRAAEYLMLSLVVVAACYVKVVYWLIKLFFKRLGRYLFLGALYVQFTVFALFVPKFYQSELFQSYIDRLQYSHTSMLLYLIAKSNKPQSWTAVGFAEDFAKVLGKGFFVNANEFVTKFDPYAKFLPIPSKKVYIIIEDIPHDFHESDDWYYRWRGKIMNALKGWVTLYSLTHNNIRLYKRTKLVTVYEIDNSAYLEWLKDQ